MRSLFLIVCLFFAGSSASQLNIDSLSHIDYQALHNANLNDVWGYVDEMGNEYAIVGTTEGTSVVNVTNPSAPFEVFWKPGSSSIWRDPCVHGDYAYVTTEADDGMLIIDLSPLPGSTALPTAQYTGSSGSPWQSAHTCYVDENGFAYIFGSNRGNGGVIILDTQSSPMAPVEVGVFDNWYVHDGFVRNDTMFLAHILNGFVSLVDVSNKANPVLLGSVVTPDAFSHNIWPSTTGSYVYTTDEEAGAYITSYDISDPQNITELDRIQNSPGEGVPPHNVHVKGDYIITSYYSDGIVIHDVSHPNNIVKVGEYDTYLGQSSDFIGCWGVYPFLPSGTILASDMTNGLFVLGPTYEKASYLEGIVTDNSSGLPIVNASVQILTNEQIDNTGNSGNYATGILGIGAFQVTYSKVGYYPQTITVVLTQGTIVYQDVQLIPIPPFNLTINVTESVTGLPIEGASILLQVPLLEHTGTTNALGQEDLILYYQDVYQVSVGKWGYRTKCTDLLINNMTGTINVELERGYYDDFTFDFGWNVSGNALTGMWERGEPFPTTTDSAPDLDVIYDCSDKAFVTGNGQELNPDADDVDAGATNLYSPSMDLTSYSDPHLNFFRWFYCMHGSTPQDTLKVFVSNGLEVVKVAAFGPEASEFSMWIPNSIRLSDYLSITNSMQVSFRISDIDPDINITEAAIDFVTITNSNIAELQEKEEYSVVVYPNPFSDRITICIDQFPSEFLLTDIQGGIVRSEIITDSIHELDLSTLPAGIYFIKIAGRVIKVIKE